MTLNWLASLVPLSGIVVLVCSVVLQVTMTPATVEALTRYLAVDDNGKDLSAHRTKVFKSHLGEAIGFDVDRIQILVTLATVPASLVLLFQWQPEIIVFVTVLGSALFIVLTSILRVVDPAWNRLWKWCSKLTAITALILLGTFLAVLFFTPLPT